MRACNIDILQGEVPKFSPLIKNISLVCVYRGNEIGAVSSISLFPFLLFEFTFVNSPRTNTIVQ